MSADVANRWAFRAVDAVHAWTLGRMLRMAEQAGDVHEENHLRAALVAGDSESCLPSCALRTGSVCVGCGGVEEDDGFYYAPLSTTECVALELVADAHAAAIALLTTDQPDSNVADTLAEIRTHILVALDRGSFRGDAR